MAMTAACKPCLVVPYYNHPEAIAAVLARIKAQALPCVLVDDGSSAAAAAVVTAIAAQEASWLTLHRLPSNQGKGAAVMAGFALAQSQGFSHAIQVDADGQHCIEDLPRFVAALQQQPQAVAAGVPQYDDSVPRHRLYGRYLTHAMVWLNTCSFAIQDSMCGYRGYPIAPALAAWREMHWGRRMDFDTEILVRMHWAGVPVQNLPTRVTYPTDGVSHFALWADNLRISAMHTRLFFGMLRRALTRLVSRR